MYLYKLDYPKAKQIIDWFDEVMQKDGHKLIKIESLKGIIANYHLFRGQYYDVINEDYESAIEDYSNALKALKGYEKENRDLMYTIYTVLAQTEINVGNLYNAEKYIKLAGGYLSNNSPNKGLFYFVDALIQIGRGDNNLALEAISRGEEEDKKFPQNEFTIPTFLLKAEILIRLDRPNEAYSITKKLVDTTHFKSDHELNARMLNELAAAELKLGKIDEAESHANEAIKKLLAHNSSLVSQDRTHTYSDDLMHLYILKGNIEFEKQNYQSAFEIYMDALKIMNNKFKKKEIDYISELYFKIATVSYKIKDMFTFNQFLKEHERNFGLEHHRTKDLYKHTVY